MQKTLSNIRVMEFKTLRFREGLNLTVRNGDKWATILDVGEKIDIQETGSGKTSYIGTVQSYGIGKFEDLTEESLQYEHAPGARTREGLKAAMDRAYGEGNWGPWLSFVYFTVEPVEDK